jgi:uncharacterized protein (UPF0548 family)
MTAEFTYPETGATRGDGPLPSGYHHLHRRIRVGAGEAAFHEAADAVLSWRMHEGMRVHPQADHPRAEAGVKVTVHLALMPRVVVLRAPCEVVWARDEPRTKGFAYGTLRGHPECGEEAFIVDWDDDDSVWLTIKAFSKADKWFTRAAGPIVPLLQNAYALGCGVVVRRLIRRSHRREGRDES